MFPAQGSRKEVKRMRISCLRVDPKCFPFLSAPLSLLLSLNSPSPLCCVRLYERSGERAEKERRYFSLLFSQPLVSHRAAQGVGWAREGLPQL